MEKNYEELFNSGKYTLKVSSLDNNISITLITDEGKSIMATIALRDFPPTVSAIDTLTYPGLDEIFVKGKIGFPVGHIKNRGFMYEMILFDLRKLMKLDREGTCEYLESIKNSN